jgi:uncharacterized protein YndB with AHSA1/START domain
MKLTRSIRIHCPRERVFEYTQDYGQRLAWDTFLREAVLLDGATEAGPGVKAWCVSKHGLGMETQYVSFQPPEVTAVKMTRGPRVFESFAGSWRFDKESPGVTRVTFTYAFVLRSPLGLLTPGMKWLLTREVQGRLEDLKRRLEVSKPGPA